MSVTAMACLSAGQREKMPDGVRPLTVVEMREVRGSDTIVPGGICQIGTLCLPIANQGTGLCRSSRAQGCLDPNTVCRLLFGPPAVNQICIEFAGTGAGCTGRNTNRCVAGAVLFCQTFIDLKTGDLICNCTVWQTFWAGNLAECF